jgi:hypothetical protein
MRILDTKILPKEKREKPSIKVLDKLYEVDNTKKTYDKLYELEKNPEMSEIEKQNKLLEILLGKKALKEILDLDPSTEEYKNLVNVVVAAATGRELEETEQTTEKK